jgi:dipeptidyl aminopeptidase/acylaminoacyl peptidase
MKRQLFLLLVSSLALPLNALPCQQLTSNLYVTNPRWSPDGTQILFSAGGGIYVITASGGQPELLISGGLAATWSPDGTRIAYGTSDALMVRDVAGGIPEVLVPERAGDPDWSNDCHRSVKSGHSRTLENRPPRQLGQYRRTGLGRASTLTDGRVWLGEAGVNDEILASVTPLSAVFG